MNVSFWMSVAGWACAGWLFVSVLEWRRRFKSVTRELAEERQRAELERFIASRDRMLELTRTLNQSTDGTLERLQRRVRPVETVAPKTRFDRDPI